MKKIVTITAICLAIVVFTACGAKKKTTDAVITTKMPTTIVPTTATPTTKTPTTTHDESNASKGLQFALEDGNTSYSVTGIGTCTDTDLIIPTKYNGKLVKSIADDAFYGCNNITSVCFEQGSKIETIGEDAFYDCLRLISVTVPSSMKKIGEQAFYNCYNLVEVYNLSKIAITMLDNLNSRNNSNGYIAYYSMDIYNSISEKSKLARDNDGYVIHTKKNIKTLITYIGHSSVVSIPNGVKEIHTEAFRKREDITKVTIPASVTKIQNSAFYNCFNLESVIFSENSLLNSIEKSAFYGCCNIITITIPASLETINSEVFNRCYRLVEVYNLSGSIEPVLGSAKCGYLGYYALDIYTNANETSKLSKNNDGYLIHTDHKNVKSLIGYYGNETDLTLPNEVTIIHKYAFYSHDEIKSVNIPSNVGYIDKNAFSDCTGLTNIIIPSSLLDLGSSSFLRCYNLLSVTFEENGQLGVIKESTFSDCTKLTSITIPSNVTEIKNSAFARCYNLTEVYNLSNAIDVTIGDSSNGYVGYYALDVYKDANEKSKLSIDDDYVIHTNGNVKTLVGYLGNNEELVIPKGITSINKFALAGRNEIKKVTIPSSVISIEESAIYYCTYLEKVIFEESSQLRTIGKKAFNHCSNLKSVIIPSSVTYIGESAFSDCSKLESVLFEENSQLELINGSAFSKCLKINNIIIPSNVTSIGESAFYICSGLQSVTFMENSKLETIGKNSFFRCSKLRSITIPSNVTSIDLSAFKDCYRLAEVYDLSNTVNIVKGDSSYGNVGFYALDVYTDANEISKLSIEENEYLVHTDTNALKTIIGYLGNDIEITVPSWASKINGYAFSSSSGITNITIPSNIENIGSYAFSSSELQSIVFEEDAKLKRIEESAFSGSKLNSIIIPSSIESIGTSAFASCSKLQSVSFEENSKLNIIDSLAFGYCSRLNSIIIPSSVAHIGDNAFKECYGLLEVYNLSSVIDVIKGDLSNGNLGYYALDVYTDVSAASKLSKDGDGYLIHTSGSVKTLVGYQGNEEELILPNGISYINNYALYNKGEIKKVTIPSSVTTVGNSAFYKCFYLENVIFEDNSLLEEIGESAFQTCPKLNNIIIPESVLKIGKKAFDSCSELTSIIFEDNSLLEEIGEFAFQTCRKLDNIIIPDSVLKIGKSAFASCVSLTSVTFEKTSNWNISSTLSFSSSSPISEDDLEVASTAATYLTTTYGLKYWQRIN